MLLLFHIILPAICDKLTCSRGKNKKTIAAWLAKQPNILLQNITTWVLCSKKKNNKNSNKTRKNQRSPWKSVKKLEKNINNFSTLGLAAAHTFLFKTVSLVVAVVCRVGNCGKNFWHLSFVRRVRDLHGRCGSASYREGAGSLK